MIYVSQGHEKGIGLEVFLKSFCCLNKKNQSQLVLVANKESIRATLESLPFLYEVSDNKILINTNELKFIPISNKKPQTTQSLEECLKHLKSSDILLTLPSSKDQILQNDKQVNGYTEFFRKRFNKPDIAMNFIAPCENVLLLTDHISIDNVTKTLNVEFIVNKTQTALNGFKNIRDIQHVFFAGIDPHCGENGQISNYDDEIRNAIKVLESKHRSISFHGPIPGDTLHNYPSNKNTLKVYSSHDQGLAPFKQKNGVVGINLSLGLPFTRISVDHGTAFNLYGQNKANYQGMLYLLNEIKNWA